MKYIMLQDKYGGKHPVIFSERLVHSDVENAVRSVSPFEVAPVSAGFVSLDGEITTHGKSDSLGLPSNPDDALYIWGGAAVNMMDPITLRMIYERKKEMERNALSGKP